MHKAIYGLRTLKYIQKTAPNSICTLFQRVLATKFCKVFVQILTDLSLMYYVKPVNWFKLYWS